MREVSVLARGFGDKILKILTRGFGKAFQLGGFPKKIKPIIREEEFDFLFPVSFYLEKILKLKFLVKIFTEEKIEISAPVNFIKDVFVDFYYPINVSYQKDYGVKFNILFEKIIEVKNWKEIIWEQRMEKKILIPLSKNITQNYNLIIEKNMSKLIKLLEAI